MAAGGFEAPVRVTDSPLAFTMQGLGFVGWCPLSRVVERHDDFGSRLRPVPPAAA